QQGVWRTAGLGTQTRTGEDVGPDGERGFRPGSCLLHGLGCRLRQALRQGSNAALRLAAACHQGADPAAQGEAVAVVRMLQIPTDDLAGQLQTHQLAGTGGRRIVAFTLGHIRTVDAGDVHLDQYFTGTGYRAWSFT